MTNYYGDFAEDETVYIPFNTFSSDDPSASVTITNLADADIHVHENGGVAQATTDGATVAIDFDGITGNHLISIDTSADAFYNTGAEYQVRIEGTTVDGATINAWVGSFSIERTGGGLALSKLIQAATITNAVGADIAADIATAQTDLDTITGAAGVVLDADAITAAKIADNAIATEHLAASAITKIWAETVEANGTRSAQETLSIILAAVAGVTSAAGLTFSDPEGTSTRITAVVNGSNERTSITLAPSA